MQNQNGQNINTVLPNSRRCVIVGGAPILDYNNAAAYLREDDYFVFCDCGLKHLQKLRQCFRTMGFGHELTPDLIVGDFDSHEKPADLDLAGVETITLPRAKDETDTAFAASEAIRRGFTDYLIIGAIGARLDHSLVNLTLLLKLSRTGCRAVIADDYSEMEIISKEPSHIDGSFKYFSLLNLFGTAHDITITGAKYNISGAEIKLDEQYATSNEVAPGQTACVTAGKGELLLIKVIRDHSELI